MNLSHVIAAVSYTHLKDPQNYKGVVAESQGLMGVQAVQDLSLIHI